jgi:hypothetical protein
MVIDVGELVKQLVLHLILSHLIFDIFFDHFFRLEHLDHPVILQFGEGVEVFDQLNVDVEVFGQVDVPGGH